MPKSTSQLKFPFLQFPAVNQESPFLGYATRSRGENQKMEQKCGGFFKIISREHQVGGKKKAEIL